MSKNRLFYRHHKLPLILTGLLVLLLSLPAWSGEVMARLNRDTAIEGDVVVLSIRAVNLPGNNQPDLAPLQQDFDILGTSNSSQVQVINGHRTDSRSWQVTLMPKRLGELTIPALSVGSEKTSPLKLTVKEVPTTVGDHQGQDVFVEMELSSDDSPYVQQASGFSVRIYSALPIREGDLGRPQSDDAVIEQLGRENVYTTNRNGRDYQVVERKYVLFPQQSGELRIPPVVFRGSVEVPQQNQQRRPRGGSMMEDFFGRDPFANDPFFNSPGMSRLFNRGQPVTVRSNAIKLNVKPVPDSVISGQWLPAEDVQLSDSWLGQSMQPTAGEPLTRTLTITAKGLSGSQLPDLKLPQTPSMRTYPEPVQHDTQTDGKTVTGTSIQTFTFVPNQAGTITIPAITLDWWDTVNDEARQTVVAEVTLDVAAGAAIPTTRPVPDPQQAAATNNRASTRDAVRSMSPATTESEDQKSLWPWFMLLAGLALIGALALFFFRRIIWFQRSSSGFPHDTPPLQSGEKSTDTAIMKDTGQLREACLTACRQNDPRTAAQSLLGWAKAEWPDKPPMALKAIAQQLETGSDEVLSLERYLYSGESGEWNGAALAAALEQGLKCQSEKSERKKTTVSLDPLYPTNF